MNTKTAETGTDLALAPSRELVSNFPTAEQISELVALTRAEAKIAAAKFDVNTATGRLNIISVSVTVRDKKVKLRKAADKSKVEHQDIIKEINEGKKTVEDELQEVQDEIRKPVTDWEDTERARVDDLKYRLGEISVGYFSSDNSSTEISDYIDGMTAIVIDDTWQEYQGEAAIQKDATLESLRNFLDLATRREAMEEELAERRAADAEREELEAYEAAQAAAACENTEFDAQLRLAQERRYDATRTLADLDNQAFDAHKVEVANAAQAATKAAEKKRLADIETAKQAERDKAKADADALAQVLSDSLAEQEARDNNKKLRNAAAKAIAAHIKTMNRDEVLAAIMANEIPHVKLIL